MDQDQFEHEWRCCLATYDTAMRAYRAAIDRSAPPDELRAAARSWWAAISAVLMFYNRPDNWPGKARQGSKEVSFEPRFGVPPELAKTLGNLAGYLAAGSIPVPMSDVRGPGRPEIGPTEKMHQATAVAYIAAVRADLIDDPHPVKTSAEAFRVTERAVQGWLIEYAFVGASDFGPPDALIEAFKQAASSYGVYGRGAKATGPRPRKMKEADRHERRAAKKRT